MFTGAPSQELFAILSARPALNDNLYDCVFMNSLSCAVAVRAGSPMSRDQAAAAALLANSTPRRAIESGSCDVDLMRRNADRAAIRH